MKILLLFAATFWFSNQGHAAQVYHCGAPDDQNAPYQNIDVAISQETAKISVFEKDDNQEDPDRIYKADVIADSGEVIKCSTPKLQADFGHRWTFRKSPALTYFEADRKGRTIYQIIVTFGDHDLVAYRLCDYMGPTSDSLEAGGVNE